MNFRRLVKKLIPKKLFLKVEPYGHWLEAVLENVVFGFPMRGLKVIGITGTAGKTTSCTLITNLLRESGLKVAMMTTISIDYGDGKGPRANTTRMTSVGSLKLIRAVKKMKANNIDWLVLETTSQALSQHRVFGVPYSIVGFTNLGHDNFHYHGSFERYRAAKVKLFKQCNRNRKGLRVGLVNSDDPSSQYFSQAIKNPITYGLNSGDLKATNVKLTASGSDFIASINKDSYKVRTNLPGKFNVYNTLLAIGIGREIGLTKKQIEQGIASLNGVEGRMSSVNEGQNFSVIVDYATTPETFNEVFSAVKDAVKGRVIAVFGSAGRRDELKRPEIGKIAGKQADIVILTEEDDRDQDGEKIMSEISEGVKKAGKVIGRDLFLIHDREKAVERAIKIAEKGDLVLLLGKGEETVIISNKPGFKPTPGHNYNESTDTIRREYNDTLAAIKAIRQKN